jgi:thiamine biosynthesis lipoprotein
MTTNDLPDPSRRDFLSGKALRAQIEQAGEKLADEIALSAAIPSAGDTIRLATRAMACEFAIIVNPGPAEQVMQASAALDLIHQLEAQMTVYRDDSELSSLNRRAAAGPVKVERELFELLLHGRQLCIETGGGFDPTSGPLIEQWRSSRQEGQIPTAAQISACLDQMGIDQVEFDERQQTIRFKKPGVELNLGGIGKGYALDRAAALLGKEGLNDWLLHGGQSSLLARGDHNQLGGWPVGIRDPLFPQQRLMTVLLKDCALSTSGTGVQNFRHEGKRYGHILDPRTGWPAENILSVTVLAPTAAQADALSTAFFVTGVENARRYCDNHKGVGAILIPPPRRGRTLEPIVCGVPDGVLFFAEASIPGEAARGL